MGYPHGKHVRVDPQHPDAIGFCDRSGFPYNRSDLIKQFEWMGNSLQWTGLWVGKDQLDVPNEQLRNPLLPPDPVPILYPRPPKDGYTQPPQADPNPITAFEADDFHWGD